MNAELARWVLLANLAATLYMTGLMWFVQLVHYPLFADVGAEGFAQYSAKHQSRTTIAVAPMLLEAAAAVALVAARPQNCPPWAAMLALAALAAIWASTAFLQVPLHGLLSNGYDAAAIRRLVDTNWIRTVLWSGRAALLLWIAARAERL